MGESVRRTTLVSVVALVLMALVLSGTACAGTATAPTTPSSTPSATGSTEPATAADSATDPATSPTDPAEGAAAEPELSADAPIVVAATVAKNVDGDTAHFNLANGTYEKVRFIGIDTPESTIEQQPWGKEASNYTAGVLTVGRTVYLETDAELRDRYGRMLAYIWLERPSSSSEAEVRAKMLNAHIALAGLANPLTIQPNSKYANVFAACTETARAKKVGMWNPSAMSIFEQDGGKVAADGVTAASQTAPRSTKVWATKSGQRYHLSGCRYLTSTKYSLTLGEAVDRGLTACKSCKPPVPN